MDILVRNRRPITMLGAMACGILLHRPIAAVDSATGSMIAPALIFAMLFVTFCKVKISQLRMTKMQMWLVLFQIAAAPLSYYAFLPLGEVVAQGAMICFLAPIAMGAVAIGALLGANIAIIASYSLVCNVAIAFVAPYMLDIFGNGECTLMQILLRVGPLLLAPLAAAQLLKYLWSTGAEWIARHSQISFYMWLVSMVVTLSRTTNYVLITRDEIALSTALVLAMVALISCIVQYLMGRKIGLRYGDGVAGAQSLGQKNTVLAVWLAQAFLSPVSSIAPTAYIVWQNIINSYQIYRHDKGSSDKKER